VVTTTTLTFASTSLLASLERGQSCPHDLIDQEEVAGDDGAGVDHLPLDVVVVVDAGVARVDGLAGGAVDADGTADVVSLAQQLDDHLLSVETYKGWTLLYASINTWCRAHSALLTDFSNNFNECYLYYLF